MTGPGGEKKLSQNQIDDMFARLAAGLDPDDISAGEEENTEASDGDSGMSQDELNNLLNDE